MKWIKKAGPAMAEPIREVTRNEPIQDEKGETE